MSALTSLLARDRILSVSKIEEALQQQVLSGGDIETVLLEMNLVQEDVLSAYRAALSGLLPATREEVMRASREALRQMPLELARRLCVIPILHEGRSLVLAANDPLSDEVARQLRAQLGCDLSIRIVNSVRLAAGLSHHYGVELDARTRRLADALRKRDPGVIPYVRPPTPGARLSMRPLAAFEDEPDSREIPIISEHEPKPLHVNLRPAALSSPFLLPAEPVAVHVSESDRPARTVLADEPVAEAPVPSVSEVEDTEEASLEDAHAFVRELDAASEAQAFTPDFATDTVHEVEHTEAEFEHIDSQSHEEVRHVAMPPPAHPAPEADFQEQELETQETVSRFPRPSLSGFQAERAATVPPLSVSPNIARAVRGPISEERAEELLLDAIHRDDVLYVLLRYAQQFFDFVAIFSVGKNDVRGRMAHGAGLSQELMEHLVIPLSEGGFATRAVHGQRPLVGDWAASDEERGALALLGRPAGRPGLGIPLAIASRVALLLYVDRLHEGLGTADAEPVVSLAPAIGTALKRIIVEQKTLRSGGVRLTSTDEPQALESQPALPSAGLEGAPEAEAPSLTLPRGDEPTSHAGGAQSFERERSFVEPAIATETAQDVEAPYPLTPVDLQAVSRLSFGERRRTVSEAREGVRVPPTTPGALDVVRGRVPGVPRSAPPPPMRDSVPPSPGGTTPNTQLHGVYSYVAPSGVMEESVRPSRKHASQPLARNLVEVREPPSEAQLSPRVTPDNEQMSLPAQVGELAVSVEPLETRPAGREQSKSRATPRSAKLSLVTPGVAVPSVIIDMGDQVNALVEALLRAGPGDPLAEIPELTQLGEGALPVLMQHFPGPLWVDAQQLERRKVRGRELSAVARCLVAFRERAAPYLASKLATSEPAVCKLLLLVAAEIAHPDLLEPVARRTFDADESVRAVALGALRGYASLPQFDAVLRAICDLSARPGKDPRRQRIALEALVALRDARSMRTLIARLLDPSEKIVRSAHRALVVLTGQDLGVTPRKWEVWAEQVAGTHRVEWLIEGLTQNDEALRGLASEELKQLTQQYFGYHPSLPKRDRELSQRKYREWWEHEGKGLFLRT